MKRQGLSKAMISGGATGFFVFLILLLSVIVFPSLGESVVGRMVGELPTPIPLLSGLISLLFGSSSNEGGILVVLTAVCAEVVLAGAIIGGLFHYMRTVGDERDREELASGTQEGEHLSPRAGQVIRRVVLFVLGLAVLFIVRAAKYRNSADFSPALLLGAVAWFVVLALSLLPGLGSTKVQVKAAISRAVLFGATSGSLLWLCLYLGGTPGPGGGFGNLVILLEFVVGYALLGFLIAVPSALFRRRQSNRES